MTRLDDTTEDTGHFVQELGLDFVADGDVWTGEASVPAGACAHGSRFPLASVLISYADVIAGSQVRAMTLPQLSVTVDLSLDVVDAEAMTETVTEIRLESTILRSGRRSYVTQTVFYLPRRKAFAICTGNFSAVSMTLDPDMEAGGETSGARPSRHERALLQTSLPERVGLVVPAPGRARLDRRADLGNSTDSLMGGLTALLGEAAAVSSAASDETMPYLAERLHIRYLAPIRVGPAEAEVEMMAGAPDRRIVRVGIRDLARPRERVADVTVACVPLPAS